MIEIDSRMGSDIPELIDLSRFTISLRLSVSPLAEFGVAEQSILSGSAVRVVLHNFGNKNIPFPVSLIPSSFTKIV
jgi:hypothetical protein